MREPTRGQQIWSLTVSERVKVNEDSNHEESQHDPSGQLADPNGQAPCARLLQLTQRTLNPDASGPADESAKIGRLVSQAIGLRICDRKLV